MDLDRRTAVLERIVEQIGHDAIHVIRVGCDCGSRRTVKGDVACRDTVPGDHRAEQWPNSTTASGGGVSIASRSVGVMFARWAESELRYCIVASRALGSTLNQLTGNRHLLSGLVDLACNPGQPRPVVTSTRLHAAGLQPHYCYAGTTTDQGTDRTA
ncbi:hypothetical protein ACIRRA_43080 [Nocardia sp. NPDC101769]|uniref:hypothetical protein n=1 Tax=Nocardia sp. NPDC101769 TaxID=3364333 RepID=UPI00381B614F